MILLSWLRSLHPEKANRLARNCVEHEWTSCCLQCYFEHRCMSGWLPVWQGSTLCVYGGKSQVEQMRLTQNVSIVSPAFWREDCLFRWLSFFLASPCCQTYSASCIESKELMGLNRGHRGLWLIHFALSSLLMTTCLFFDMYKRWVYHSCSLKSDNLFSVVFVSVFVLFFLSASKT